MFEPTDSAGEKILFIYRLLVHDKVIQLLPHLVLVFLRMKRACTGPSPPVQLWMPAHVLAQHLVYLGLVFLATILEPGEHVSVEPQADGLLDRPVETPTHGAVPIAHFGDIPNIGLRDRYTPVKRRYYCPSAALSRWRSSSAAASSRC